MFFRNKLVKLIGSSDMEKLQLLRYRQEIIKQLNTPKTFDMEPRKAIPEKDFVLEEEINLTIHYRINNTDWCKCEHQCKPMTTFAENFCLLLRLKSWSVREASSHSAFMDNYPTISHKF